MGLVLGGCVIACAAFLAGATGFGFALASTPFLLLVGFPLKFVVTANLALALITRVFTSWHLRKYIILRQVSMLVLGSVPGFYLGILILTCVNESTIKLAAGAAIMAVALLLWRSMNTPPPSPIPGVSLIAGLAGGFLGSTTSLSGIPPALLLTHSKANQLNFLADLAVYFVISSSIALFLFTTQGVLATEALFPASLLWLPGALLGNFLGTIVAPYVPERLFRYITLGLVFVAGGTSVATAGVF